MAQDIGILEQKDKARLNVAKAVLGGEVSANTTNEDEKAILALRQKLDHDAPLSEFQTTPVSSASAAEAVEKSIGWEWKNITDPLNPTEVIGRKKDRSPTAIASKADAEAYIDIVQNFLKKGYSDKTMSDPERKVYQDIALKTALKIWGETAVVLEGVSDTERRKLMDRILKSPLYAEKLKEALEAAVEFGKKPPEVTAEVEEQVDGAKFDFEIKKKELKALQDKLVMAKDLAKEYGHTETEGKQIAALQVRQASLGTVRDKIAEINDKVADAKVKVAQLTAIDKKKGGLDPTQTAQLNEATNLPDEVRDELNSAKRLEREIVAEAAVLTRLQGEKKAAEAEQRKLEEEEQKKYLEVQRAQKRYFTLLAEKDEIEVDSQRHEKSFKSKLEGAPEAAMRSYLEEMVKEYEEARETLIKKNGDAQLSIGLANRWNFPGGPGTKKRSGELNKAAIKEDYTTLIVDGPDEVVIRTLIAGGMGREEAVAKLENNESFAKKARQDVVERLLSRQLISGKISPTEAARIVENNEWGGSGLINRALENRLNYVAAPEREALKAAGVLSSGFSEKLRSLPKDKLIRLLIMILVIGVLSLNLLGSFGLLTAAVGKVGAVATGAYHGVTGAVSGAYHGVTGAVGGGIDSVHDAVTGSKDAVGEAVSGGSTGHETAGIGSIPVLGETIPTGAISQGVPPGVINSAAVGGVELGSDVAASVSGATSVAAAAGSHVAVDAASAIGGATPGITSGVVEHGGNVLQGFNNLDNADKIVNTGVAVGGGLGAVKIAKSIKGSGH